MGSDFKKIVAPVLDVLEFTYQPIIYPARQIGRLGQSIGDRLFPDMPSLSIPPFPEQEDLEQEEAAPLVDEDEARRLAEQRRSLERKRRGRSSLRITSPALASSLGSGLRIT